MTEFLLFGFVVLVMGTWFVLSRTQRPKFHAHAEYWVYLPGETLPPQEAIMDRMMRSNPFARTSEPPIGVEEGLIFSDIRLHMAMVRRALNPHVFQIENLAGSDESLEPVLRHCRSFVKLRYISEDPLKDRRHLQFLAHASAAIAHLGGGLLVYDLICERFWRTSDFESLLTSSSDATRAEIQITVHWRPSPEPFAEALGFQKIGLPDLRTGLMSSDGRILVCDILRAAATKAWASSAHWEEIRVDLHQDTFQVVGGPTKARKRIVRIQRIQRP